MTDQIPLANQPNVRLPHPLIALIPVLVLVGMMVLMITLFGSDALGGGTQIALLLASAVCISISMLAYRVKWQAFERVSLKRFPVRSCHYASCSSSV